MILAIWLGQVWGSTKLRGEVLDYLGQLVLQVSAVFWDIFYPTFFNYFPQGAIDPVGERIYTLEQSEIAFRELAAGGHKVRLVLMHTNTDKVEEGEFFFLTYCDKVAQGSSTHLL